MLGGIYRHLQQYFSYTVAVSFIGGFEILIILHIVENENAYLPTT
jgi:Na+-translocating ferredoxin:NAD+ oxidoreductase RnfD subunit